MKKINSYLFLFLFCAFNFFITSSKSEETPKFTKNVLKNVKLFSQGKKVWFDQCTHCHGFKAYPGKAPKLKPKKYKPEWVFKRVTDGFRKMPAWKEIYSLEERKAVVVYIMHRRFSP